MSHNWQDIESPEESCITIDINHADISGLKLNRFEQSNLKKIKKMIKKEKKKWLHLQRQSNIPRATMHMSQIKNHAYESNKKRIRTNIGK